MPVTISRRNGSENQGLFPPGHWLCLSCTVEVFCYNTKVNICPNCRAKKGTFTQIHDGPPILQIGNSSHATWEPVPGNSYSFWIAAPNASVPPQSVHTGDDSAYPTRPASVINYCSPTSVTVYPTQTVVRTLAVPAAEPFHHQLSQLDDASWYHNAQEYAAQNTHERPLTTTGPLILGGADQDPKFERRNHKTLPRLSIPAKPVSYPRCNWADMRPASPLRDWHKRGKKEGTNLRGGHIQKYYSESSRRHERRYPKAVQTLPRLRQRNSFVRAQASASRADLKKAHDNDMRRQRKQAWKRSCQRIVRSRAAFADGLMQSGNTSLSLYVRQKSNSPSIKQELGLVLPELSLPCTHSLPLPHRIGNYVPTPSGDAIKQELTTSTMTMDSLPFRPRIYQSAPHTYATAEDLSTSPVYQSPVFPLPPAREATGHRNQVASEPETQFELGKI